MSTHSLITMRETLGSSQLGRSTESNGATFNPTVRIRGFVTEYNLEYAFNLLDEYVKAYNERFPLMHLQLEFIGYVDLGTRMSDHHRKIFGADLIENLFPTLVRNSAAAGQPKES